MFKAILNPYFLTGTGTMVLFGVGVYEYAKRQTEATGFHVRDPDTRLRKLEKDVLVAKYMRDRLRAVECKDETDAFNNCCIEQNKAGRGLFAFTKCKTQNDTMMECMNKRFLDEDFYKMCKELYLYDKALFLQCKVKKRSREKIKKIIKEKLPLDAELDEDQKIYFKGVMSVFIETGNVDEYDEILLKDTDYDKTKPA